MSRSMIISRDNAVVLLFRLSRGVDRLVDFVLGGPFEVRPRFGIQRFYVAHALVEFS